MKKLLIASNLIWVFLFAFLFFEGCKPSTDTSLKEGDIVMNYKDSSFNSLPLPEARSLYSNYVAKRIPLVNKFERIKDAESVWFSLDEIKQLAYITEYYTQQANVGVTNKELGIRVYYGKYANETKTDTTSKKENDLEIRKKGYSGLHTVFMVPTFRENGQDVDFDPKTSYKRINDKSSEVLITVNITSNLIKGASSQLLKSTRAAQVAYEPDGVVLNHGNLCPPCIKQQ